jgi:hypothetical protein
MKREVSLPCSQQPATSIYSEPREPNPRSSIRFININLILSSSLGLGFQALS